MENNQDYVPVCKYDGKKDNFNMIARMYPSTTIMPNSDKTQYIYMLRTEAEECIKVLKSLTENMVKNN